MGSGAQHDPGSTVSLVDLPADELRVYAGRLGVRCDRGTPREQLLQRIRQQRETLLELDREALLEICAWARRPVRKSAGKEDLGQEIATVHNMDFDGLSDRGLYALCRLRQVPVDPPDARTDMVDALRKAESWRHYVQRQQRRLLAGVLTRLVRPPAAAEPQEQDYQFLPERPPSIAQQIEQDGVVGGLKRRIKGVADDYVREKLDEIERRIDRKLDQIDRRLGEWRDREVRNRLRIIKITLVASIIVAVLSLGYDYLARPAAPPAGGQEAVELSQRP